MEGVFTEGTKFFVGQGILGFVVLVLAWAYWSCRSQVNTLYTERLGDFRATLETIHANNQAISDVTQATRARTDAAEAIAEAQKMQTAEAARSTQEILRLHAVVSDLEKEISQLRTEMVRRGIA